MWLEGQGGTMSEEMKREMKGLKSAVSALEIGFGGLRSDVDGLKKDVSGLKNDVSGLKSDVSGLKSDVGNLATLARNSSVILARLVGDFADMKRNMATKDDISMIMKRIDGFADMLQDSRWDWGKQKVRLDDHEKRISALETKRA